MNKLSKELAAHCLIALNTQEGIDVLALGMRMNKGELRNQLTNGRPVALRQSAKKWMAALWVPSPDNDAAGELYHVAKDCRNKKLALITANYFRLHCLINKTNTDFSTSQQ